MKNLVHHLQARSVNRIHAKRAQPLSLCEPHGLTLAAVEVGGEVESLHGARL